MRNTFLLLLVLSLQFIVHIRMPDGRVVDADKSVPSVPKPDGAGMFHFRVNKVFWAVHASNVWFEER